MLELFSLREFFSAAVVLFAIIDIIGTAPVVVNLQKKGKIVNAFRASVVALLICVGFLYVGEAFLKLFNLDISSFAIAGSIILFVLALEMILDIQIFRDSPDLPKDATITPVVFPLIIGAGSMTTLLSLRAEFAEINILLAIVANVVIIYFVLKMANTLQKVLGPGVIYVLQKLFGIILLAISVKLFITNLSIFIQNIG